MKKIIGLLIVITTLVTLTGCGNYMLLDTTYKYDKVHIHNENKCFEVKSWTDYEGEQIQVELSDGTVILLSSINCTLVHGECPFCEEK
jgi:hypothetical protein